MRWRAALVCVFVLLAAPVTAAPSWIRAVGYIDGQCTVWAVRPFLLVTASHCVYRPGDTHDTYYIRGVQEVKVPAMVVWDGAWADEFSDLALLVPDVPWPVALPLASPIPSPGTPGVAATYTLGMRWWTVPVEILGLTHVQERGWMILFRGDVASGSSGSPILVDNKVVGVISAGVVTLRLHVATPAGPLARAIRSYDKYGPMPNP